MSNKQLTEKYASLKKKFKKLERKLQICENRYESLYALIITDTETRKWFMQIVDKLTSQGMNKFKGQYKQSGGMRGLKPKNTIKADMNKQDDLNKELNEARNEFKKSHKPDGLTGK